MSRLYFGDYCAHKDAKGPCLNETDTKCPLCGSPRCSKHLKRTPRSNDKRICVRPLPYSQPSIRLPEGLHPRSERWRVQHVRPSSSHAKCRCCFLRCSSSSSSPLLHPTNTKKTKNTDQTTHHGQKKLTVYI